MTPQPYISKQFPITPKPEKKKSATGTYQLLYNGQEICKGNSKLVYGRKANLSKSKNFNKKLFTVKTI